MLTTFRSTLLAAALAVSFAGLAAAQEAPLEGSKDLDSELAKNLTIQQRPMAELMTSVVASEPAPMPSPELKLSVWVDRDSLTYRIGEPVRLHVKANQDCYVTVLDTGPDGRPVVLLPNRFQSEAFLRAGTIIEIPGDKAGWDIVASPPAGFELITVVATRTRPVVIESSWVVANPGPFRTLGPDGETVAKNLQVALRQNHRQQFAVYHKRILVQ